MGEPARRGGTARPGRRRWLRARHGGRGSRRRPARRRSRRRTRGASRGRHPVARSAGGATPAGCEAGVPRIAAPSATSCLGWLSSASGRPNAAESISLTSGIRDEPPTSTIAATSAAPTPDASSTRRIAETVSAIAGRSMSSNSPRVSRTDRVIPGSATGTTVSTLKESTSLASTQSRRSRASAVAVAGSVSSRRRDVVDRSARRQDVPEHRLVEVDPAQVLDPLRRPHQPEARTLAREHRRVERAPAQVVHRDASALGHPVPRRVRDRRRLRLGAGARRPFRAVRPSRSPGPAGRA